MTEQYKCQSYYDDDNVLQDCTCGKCEETTWSKEFRQKLGRYSTDSRVTSKPIIKFVEKVIKQATSKKRIWVCGKCEQEQGKYPNAEILLKHSLHCYKRLKDEFDEQFPKKDFNFLERGGLGATDCRDKLERFMLRQLNRKEKDEVRIV